MSGWTSPYNLLSEEFVQRRDEGCAIPAALEARFRALDRERDAWNESAIAPIYDALMALPEDAALAAAEPNDLERIRALRPPAERSRSWRGSDAELLDRLHGAWTGRSVGCALGKPVEGMGMGRDKQGALNGRATIRAYLEHRQDWPLGDYFSGREIGDGLTIGCAASQREHIRYMESDDDINYSLTGLGVLEECGPDFTWRDVGRYWLAHLPIMHICTAETQAISNLQLLSCRGHGGPATPEFTRRHRNPYREWIGAQIRADGWAWCCAGNPELAAEFAWRDAHWTHERNGIYGEMMLAAMQAGAFIEPHPRALVEIGLAEIPHDCRLARWVRTCLGWIESEPDFESCMRRIEAELGGMHVVHTINNALICVLSLFYGRMRLEAAVPISVMCGLDTDCNGASVGSIVGASKGRRALTSPLVGKLNDTIRPGVVGFLEVSMTDLARRTLVQCKRVDAYAKARTPAAVAAG